MDIAHAFENVPICKEEWHLMGFCFQGKYFVGTQLPFRATASSCKVIKKVAMAMEWIVKNETQVQTLSYYLDDYFLVRA